MDENKKEHHLHIVLTTQQYQLLCCQAKECRLTKRAYLARLIEGRPVKARPTKEIKELRTEIHHIGNNINQIARSVNAGIAKPEDAERGLYLLDQVYELIITVDGMDVEVPEDVYLAYAQADRRERYIMEEQSSGKLLSLEQMEEDALLPDYVGAETAPSAETEALEREELRNLAEQKQILLLALLSLKDTDRELINALFFDGASTREYAQRMGVSQRAVIKRRDRILRDLKKFFENSSK